MSISHTRRAFLATLTALSIGCLSSVCEAHHGWAWATDEEFEITGKIVKVRLGNPHGEVTIKVKDEEWLIEVGQPWRNERAGLTPEKFKIGQVITVHGHRSAKASERLVKAERLVIDGQNHDLYPDRPS